MNSAKNSNWAAFQVGLIILVTSAPSVSNFPVKVCVAKQMKGTMTAELEAALKAVRDQGQPSRLHQDTRSSFSNNLLCLAHDLIAAAAQALGEFPVERKDKRKMHNSRMAPQKSKQPETDRRLRVHSLKDAIRNRGGITLPSPRYPWDSGEVVLAQCIEADTKQVPCVPAASVEISDSSVGLPLPGLAAAGCSLEVPVSSLEMSKSSLPCTDDGKENEAKAQAAENDLAETACHEDTESETETESSEWEEENDEDGEVPGLHPAAPRFMKHICRAFPTITQTLDLSDENLVKELAAPFLG